jgi:hypothetical protein
MRGFCLRNAFSAVLKCSIPKLTGAEIRSGPTSSPRRSDTSAVASATSRTMRFARWRNAIPSSVSISLRVERRISVAPMLRSSSAKRSLATDFDICRRLAASLIELVSAVVTKVRRDSSFNTVRLSWTLVPVIGG